MVQTLRDLIIELFGNYTPNTFEVYDSTLDTYISTIPDGMSGVDWVWLSGVVLFGITLYCVFHVFGVVIYNAFRNK